MVQEIPYTLIKKIERLEIRRYPEVILATVEDTSDNSGFGHLFQYISGENKAQRKIAMTAPVITSEKLKMTTLVISKKGHMAFVLPVAYTNETVPLPTNPAVNIKIQPEREMAVLRFSGHATQERVEQFIQKLITTLQAQGIQMVGEPVLMRYNSPFTPGFLRRNEIAIEINPLKGNR
jgi:effector-binding domain-containing protein